MVILAPIDIRNQDKQCQIIEVKICLLEPHPPISEVVKGESVTSVVDRRILETPASTMEK